jgi:hypothetical protein
VHSVHGRVIWTALLQERQKTCRPLFIVWTFRMTAAQLVKIVVSVNREVWVSGLKQMSYRTEKKLKNEYPACWDVMPYSLVYVYRRFRGPCQCAQWLYSTRVLFLRSAVAVQTFRASCTWPQHTKCGRWQVSSALACHSRYRTPQQFRKFTCCFFMET